MNILEEFWYGNIEPAEYDTSSSKEYKELLQLISRNEEKLLATMTDPQKALFTKYADCVREYQVNGRNQTYTVPDEHHLYVILGVSTSSCVGAALGIVLGFGVFQTQLLAFILGVLNIGLIFILSSRIKLDKTLSLILSGILIGGAMSSVLALIKYMANPETQLQAIVFWTMGDISSISLEQLGFIAIPVTICSVILFLKSWDLNYFCFVDSEAKSMGFI